MTPKPKVAIVADWLTNLGGAERVVLTLVEAFPGADIFTSVYEPDDLLSRHFDKLDVKTTWLQKLPKVTATMSQSIHTVIPTTATNCYVGVGIRMH